MCSACRGSYEDPERQQTDAEAKEIVDRLCDEAAFLMYGVSYAYLTPTSQSRVIAEVLAKFNPRDIDAADYLRKARRGS